MVDQTRNTTKRRMTSVSPPPTAKRTHIQSTTTKVAITTFFAPASQKPPEQLKWQERAVNENNTNTLLVATYSPIKSTSYRLKNGMKHKIAAFDFDQTLVSTVSGNRFAKDGKDWKWWHPSIPTTLRRLVLEDGYTVVIISNQAGIKLKDGAKISSTKVTPLAGFKGRIDGVTKQLDIPLMVYAATEKDIFRKPRPGIWKELLEDLDLDSTDVDYDTSIFVGDAGGRVAEGKLQKDFSCSDRNFAENIGLMFKTPEEFFLQESPRRFVRDFDPLNATIEDNSLKNIDYAAPFLRKNKKDIVLFCGSPGAGKSTAYWRYLEPQGYERVNQDILKTLERCLKVAEEYLLDNKSVVVDNTNADFKVRHRWVDLAKRHNIPIRCFHLTTSPSICSHNNVVRALNSEMNPEQRQLLPEIAFHGFHSRFQEPKLDEGFQVVTKVDFKFDGTHAEKAIWSRYWI